MKIFELFQDDKNFYFVTEYLSGFFLLLINYERINLKKKKFFRWKFVLENLEKFNFD